MNAGMASRDLIVLVADLDAENVLRALLEKRTASLGIRSVRFVIQRHLQRDAGCMGRAHLLLSSNVNRFDRALVVFDRHGCGREKDCRESIEQEVEKRLVQNGWANRCAAVVIDPELEAWVWSSSPEVDRVLGWTDRQPDLRTTVREWGLWPDTVPKPSDPKEAMERALRAVGMPISADNFRKLATCVSLQRCADPSFLKLRSTLRAWFPPDSERDS